MTATSLTSCDDNHYLARRCAMRTIDIHAHLDAAVSLEDR